MLKVDSVGEGFLEVLADRGVDCLFATAAITHPYYVCYLRE